MALIKSFGLFLQQNSLQFSEDNEGRRIFFTRNGKQYVFLFDPQDAIYFRILLPRVGHIDNPSIEELQFLLDLSEGYKAGKVFFNDNEVWLAFEQFTTDPDIDATSLFRRGLSVLDDMLEEYNRHQQNNQNGE